MEAILIPILYVAIPAIILMLAFVAFLRKEEKEVADEMRKENDLHRNSRH